MLVTVRIEERGKFMKKILVLVIILMLVISISALAESTIDLSGLSIEELIGLKSSVNEELHNRIGSDDSEIYSGKYIVGKNINPGKYTITCTESVGGGLSIDVYLLVEDKISYEGMLNPHIYLNVGETGFIQLEEGTVLEISDGTGLIQASNPTWAK